MCVVEQAPRLFEHEVSHRRFEIPIDYRDRRQIERSMRTHHRPDPARGCKDRPEDASSSECRGNNSGARFGNQFFAAAAALRRSF